MEVIKVLQMNGGDKETSYAKNSSIQNIILSLTKSIRQSAAAEFFATDSLCIADLGCSSGPNALVAVSDVIEAVTDKCRVAGSAVPDFVVLLNDLPSNDFNTVFALLPEFYEKIKGRCFVYGVPGSFYGRLFESNSVHIVHSSMSLHWLSRVPKLEEEGSNMQLNKENVQISKTSHPSVFHAYLFQFQSDFSLFLKCRYEEMIIGGKMILTFLGRKHEDPATEENCYHWNLLAETLGDMASEGLVKEEDTYTFNVPCYAPSLEELKNVITKQGYFDIDILDTFETSWESVEDGHEIFISPADRVGKTMRAVFEPILVSHFGEDVMDELFKRYHHKFEVYFSENRAIWINVIISLVKKNIK